MKQVIKSIEGVQSGAITCNGYAVVFETSLDSAETIHIERDFSNLEAAETWLDLMVDAFKNSHSQLTLKK